MENNDILIRLRYAQDIKNVDMVDIFKLGGVVVTKDEVLKMLKKPEEVYGEIDVEETDDYIKCNNKTLESFLNGFIIFKRGRQEPKPGQPETPPLTNEHVNNMLLKKVKIALSLTTEDMLDLFQKAGITVTKSEIGAILRKPGHKNYKECGDKFARNFLKGLALKYRG
jgi:uncharacterized protein YehS (DUF1456 family)